MKPITRLAALALFAAAPAIAQQTVNCATNVPCAYGPYPSVGGGPYNNSTADLPPDAFGRVNSNFTALAYLYSNCTAGYIVAAPPSVAGLPSCVPMTSQYLPGNPVVPESTTPFNVASSQAGSVFAVSTSSNWTANLPQIGSAYGVNPGGFQFLVPNPGTGTGTFAPYTGQTITTTTLPAGANALVFADNTGSNWYDVLFPGMGANTYSGTQTATAFTASTGNVTATAGNIVATAGNIIATAGSIKAGIIAPQTGGTCASGLACIMSPAVQQFSFWAGTTQIGGTDASSNFNWTGGNIVASTGNITATAGNIVATAGSIKAGLIAPQTGGSCSNAQACILSPTAGQMDVWTGATTTKATHIDGNQNAYFYGAIQTASTAGAPGVACAVAPGLCTGITLGTGATANVGTFTLTASATGVSSFTLTWAAAQAANTYWICTFNNMTHITANATQVVASLSPTKVSATTNSVAQSGDVFSYICFPQ